MATEYVLVDPSPERTILDLRKNGFKEILVTGRYEYTRAHPPLETHSHGPILEISYLERGEQTYVVDGKEYHMRGGDVFVTQPDQPHGTGNYPEGKGVMFWMLIRLPGESTTILDLPEEEGAELIKKLRNLPHHFRGHRSLKETLYRIFEVHGRDAGTLQTLNIRNLLIRYLLDVAHSAEFEDQSQISPEILEVMRFVRENLERNYMLEDLAARVGLSVSRFKARFKDEVGVPPADYVARQKVNKAMKLLRTTGMPITQIATSLGYSSSQYFATAFRRYSGKTPSQARREAYADSQAD